MKAAERRSFIPQPLCRPSNCRADRPRDLRFTKSGHLGRADDTPPLDDEQKRSDGPTPPSQRGEEQ